MKLIYNSRVPETVNNPNVNSRPAVIITPLDGDSDTVTPSTSTYSANVSLNLQDTNAEVNNHPYGQSVICPKTIRVLLALSLYIRMTRSRKEG